MGERLLVETQENDRFTLWSLRVDGRGQEQLLTEAHPCAPLWSRQEDAFYSLRRRNSDVDLMKATIDRLSGRLVGQPTTLLTGLDIAQGPDYFTWVSLSRSPDGARVVVFWNRVNEGQKLWLVSLSDRTQRPLTSIARLHQIIGWGADGKWIYLQRDIENTKRTELLRISATSGTVEPWVTLPFVRTTECSTMTTDGLHFVCAVSEGDSDAWLVEGFDAPPT